VADDLGTRCEELAHDVLAPLVLGGEVRPTRPFGGPLGLRLGEAREIQDLDLRMRIDVARVRRARLVAPVDVLPPLDAHEWSMLAALNDLLQLTNHHLGGPLRRGRYGHLLANLRYLCARIPRPHAIVDALCRHATFARALALTRTDSVIAWWTGSARFRGEVPPKRLLAWRELRRVQVEAQQIPLAQMATGLAALSPDAFTDVLRAFLALSPLTDLATADRDAPAFAWSSTTLGLVSVAEGRALAFRALCQRPAGKVLAALEAAAPRLPAESAGASEIAAAFHAAVKAGFEALEASAAP
jgi:hypothetical protein